ncbi:MAG: hypothetical protein WD894_09640 [Pirellulales bacterium]
MRLQGLDASSRSYGWGVSADGGTVVGTSDGAAVLWTADGRVMRVGGARYGRVIAASWDGSIVAGWMGDFARVDAFRWTAINDRVVTLGRLPGDTLSRVSDMTPDGRLIVGTSEMVNMPPDPHDPPDIKRRGFRWTEETGMVELPGFIPHGLSDDGRVIIGFSLSSRQPGIWFEGAGVMDLQPFLTGLGLDLTGWTIRGVSAISGDGTTIAGSATPPDRSLSGVWVATIPEPSTGVLGGAAVVVTMLGMLLHRRRSLATESAAARLSGADHSLGQQVIRPLGSERVFCWATHVTEKGVPVGTPLTSVH